MAAPFQKQLPEMEALFTESHVKRLLDEMPVLRKPYGSSVVTRPIKLNGENVDKWKEEERNINIAGEVKNLLIFK